MKEDDMQKEVKYKYLYPFTLVLVKATTCDDIINGFGLYFLGRSFLTVAKANNLWIDSEGKPYNFKKDGNIFFMRKLAISLNSN